MTLSEYEKIITKSLNSRTLVFLKKDKRVLLGLKKKGFGKGYWLGIGGKVEPGETIEDAAKREVQEEIHVELASLKEIAVLNFYFPEVEDESWNQKVHVFIAMEWQPEPSESEEIKPQWFDINKIPLQEMWDDAHYWLPQILGGKEVKADFLFDKNLKVVNYKIQ